MIITSMFLKVISSAKPSPPPKEKTESKPAVTSMQGKVSYDYFKRGIKHDSSKAAYSDLEERLAPLKAKVEEMPLSPLQRARTAINNIPVQIKNAYGLTIGYGLAKGQNFTTTRALKKDPALSVGYVINGNCQNIGPGYGRGKALKKRGLLPYHLKNYDNEPLPVAHRKVLGQVKGFHNKVGITDTDAYKRHDSLVGHSYGGKYGRYASTNSDTYDHGIKTIQAIASPNYGMKLNKLSHKLLGLFMDMSSDDVKRSRKAREEAVKLYNRKPVKGISIEGVAGDHDGLVNIKDTVDPYLHKHHVLHHPKSTHFGTSGSEMEINEILADLLMAQRANYEKKYRGKEYKLAA